jgi:hypothetical protein
VANDRRYAAAAEYTAINKEKAMSVDQKVLVATLWQRTSERGNEYLSGFLGKARLVGFRGEARPDGTPTWDVYLTPGKEQKEGATSRGPTAMSRTGVQRWERRQEKPTADSAEPFFDDPIDDVEGS